MTINIRARQIFTAVGLAAAVMFTRDAAASGNLVNFTFKSTMINTGADADARGKIEGGLNNQGNQMNQTLKLNLGGLDRNSLYRLSAYLGDDTNLTVATTFYTDANGGFKAQYTRKIPANLFTRNTLPGQLSPLCNIRELDIVNDFSSEVVLRTALTNPDQGQYLAKRQMINTGFVPAAKGEVQITGSPKSTKFQLTASQLTTNMPYWLSINGVIVQTNTTDKSGKLQIKTLPPGSPSALEIQSITLTESAGTNLVLITQGLGIPCHLDGAQQGVVLGAAANFAVLAGATVKNTGPTIVNGDLGVYAGSAVVGFPPGTVNGNIHAADDTAGQAELDLTTAFNDAAGRTVGPVSVAGNLGGLTLPPGLYKSTSSLEISSGDLTLDAKGDANAVFIFQIASTLTTTSGRQVVLSGGAQAGNVYWQVGTSATLGTTTIFKGTIMADQAITLETGATLDGRALARIAAVTLDSNTVTLPSNP